ncbi:hypothetical protein QJS04_geneDACA022361 [Acorus gramineus]|uniref:Uncharacterized protein n=1 Tax=Acorus gramineus TaxID=55184 RepID=A0AAV9B279_ACOGR|nr:hypothetical protein QJS04_geneDACA022361 [Acorus gramineus]
MVAEELGNLPLESLGVVIERFIGQRPNLECYAVWKEAFLAGKDRSQRACEVVHQTLKMNHNEPHHNPSSSKLDFVPGSKKQDLLANEMHGLLMGEGLISESQEMAENMNSSSRGKSVADVTLPDLNHLVQQECTIDKQMPKQSTKKSPHVHYSQILNEMAFRMTTEQLFAIQKPRTRNTEDLHQLVFGERGLPDNTPVGYRIEKNKVESAYITKYFMSRDLF